MSKIWDLVQEVADRMAIDLHKIDFLELTLEQQMELISMAENEVLGI
jgi:hypothetical protein|tara:strand:- start:71 stop:211 length:141 start_codon:yes stop_codon:yes gene_type:complete